MKTRMVTWHVDRLGRQWVGPFTAEVNDEPVTDWTYLILPRGERPLSAADIDKAPIERTNGLGVLVGPGSPNVLGPGIYRVWIKYEDEVEAPVYGAFATIVIQ